MLINNLRYHVQRKSWRQRARKYVRSGDVKLVFLVASPPDTDTLDNVIEESTAFNDIVLTSIEDGHRCDDCQSHVKLLSKGS